jgi:hypothetical protein
MSTSCFKARITIQSWCLDFMNFMVPCCTLVFKLLTQLLHVNHCSEIKKCPANQSLKSPVTPDCYFTIWGMILLVTVNLHCCIFNSSLPVQAELSNMRNYDLHGTTVFLGSFQIKCQCHPTFLLSKCNHICVHTCAHACAYDENLLVWIVSITIVLCGTVLVTFSIL